MHSRVLLAFGALGLATTMPLSARVAELDAALTTAVPVPAGGLDAVAGGNLRITWRREGPELSVGELVTVDDLQDRKSVV